MTPPNQPSFEKLFSLIVRIREYEGKPAGNFGTRIKYRFYTYRDRIRTKLGLFVASFLYPPEKDSIFFLKSCYKYRRIARGQIFQDVLAILISPRRHGFFVEFGATDGVFLSNTYLLENRFSWKGILAEPARIWAEELRANRSNSLIDFRCVWRESGKQIEFMEDVLPEISGISTMLNKKRMSGSSTSYLVDTVSLIDLLDEHHAPAYIDYLSIDTEGSEFEILEHFDFSRYQFGLITVEHNSETEKRENIFALLTKHHYKRIFQNFSGCDDWYVPASHKFEVRDLHQTLGQ
jgi:FkbM family methyltransferase